MMVGMISRMILLSLSLVLSAVAFATPAQRAVLVTGATSGIGLRTAEHLSASGFYVYAGARKQADMDRLNAMKNVEAVKLDVTSLEDITAAVEQITKGGKGLHGIVNNAGVVIFQPLIEVV
jgi:NADP-dependent 3-hydroxy acid dehydrogenase YdfG